MNAIDKSVSLVACVPRDASTSSISCLLTFPAAPFSIVRGMCVCVYVLYYVRVSISIFPFFLSPHHTHTSSLSLCSCAFPLHLPPPGVMATPAAAGSPLFSLSPSGQSRPQLSRLLVHRGRGWCGQHQINNDIIITSADRTHTRVQ